jgi:hypothetical protein
LPVVTVVTAWSLRVSARNNAVSSPRLAAVTSKTRKLAAVGGAVAIPAEAAPPATPWRKDRRWKGRNPLITGSPGRSFSDAPSQDSVALIFWRSITVSARRALVLATVSGLLLTGTEVQRWL